jgi:hypothetical protein
MLRSGTVWHSDTIVLSLFPPVAIAQTYLSRAAPLYRGSVSQFVCFAHGIIYKQHIELHRLFVNYDYIEFEYSLQLELEKLGWRIKMKDDKCDKSHIADYQNGIDLSVIVTVGMTFVKENLYFKLYVLDNYEIIIMFNELECLATLNN